jgi:hypothetical protein
VAGVAAGGGAVVGGTVAGGGVVVAGAGCCCTGGGTVRAPGSSKSLSWGLPTVFVSCAWTEFAATMRAAHPSAAPSARKEPLTI